MWIQNWYAVLTQIGKYHVCMINNEDISLTMCLFFPFLLKTP